MAKSTRTVKKLAIGLIRKKATLHVQQHTFFCISLPLFYTTTSWNFQQLPGYTFYGGNVVRVLVHFCFSLSLIFILVAASISHFHTAATNFHVVHSNKKCLLCFFSLDVALFLCLSLSLYSKFVDMTINLRLILKTTRIQKYFPLSVFVFIESLVVSASQDAVAIRFPAKITWNWASAYISVCIDGQAYVTS